LKTADNSGKYITVFSIYNSGGEIVKKGVIPAIVVLVIVFWPFIQRFYKEMNPTPQEVTIQGIVNVEKARMMIKLNRQIVRKYGVNAYSKSELSWAEGIMEQYGEPY